MAIDPKAAAAAAQAAAEAAKAAAAEAAREAAIAAARAEAAAGADAGTATTSRTIGGADTREILDDTGVNLGSELSGSQSNLSDLRETETSLGAGAAPADLLALPELGSIGSRTGANLSMPGLDGGATGDGGSAYMGKAGLMDGGALRDAIASTPYYNQGADAGTPDGGTTTGQQGGWMGDRDGQGFLSTQGARTRYRFNEDGEVEATTTTEGTANEDTTTTAGAQANAGQVEGGSVKDDDAFGTFWEGVKDKVGSWWDSLGGDDSDADAGTTGADGGSSGGDAGAAGGGVGDVPMDDAPVTRPPGWIDVDDLDFIDEQRRAAGAVPGGKGMDPSGGDDEGDGRPGPQGGSWAINPNPEGDIATNVQAAVPRLSGADLFGQPEPEAEPIAGDPTMMQPPAMVDPNTVNPSRADSGETSDSGVQASTAYQAMPPAADSGAGATESTSGDGGGLDATVPAADDDGGLVGGGVSSDDQAQPYFAADDAEGGRGHAYGRDGDRGSHGRGGPGDRPDDGDDVA